MGRRVKYDPALVVKTVLSKPLLYRICEVVFTSDRPMHSTEVARALGITQGYAYSLLRRLEKWGVLEPVRDPRNGKTAFRPSERKVAKVLAEEIKKRRAAETVLVLGREVSWSGIGEEEDRY